MSPFRILANLRRNLFARRRIDNDLDDELRSHLELVAEARRAAGDDANAARRSAFIEMGGVEQVKEEIRQGRSGHLLVELLQDLRYAVRMLRKNLLFTCTAVLALALGIGANTAIFSVAYGTLLRPLPYPDADRVAVVYMHYYPRDFKYGTLCVRDYLMWKEDNRSFENPSLFRTMNMDLGGSEGVPRQVHGASVTADFFATLRVQPLLGRTFDPGEEKAANTSLTVLSEAIWRSRFAASPAVLGRAITVNGTPSTVIGVMSDAFRFPRRDTDIWTNLAITQPSRFGPWFYRGVARLKPGVSMPQAQAELDHIGGLLMRENSHYRDLKFPVLKLRDALLGTSKPAILMLAGTVGLVLLIALVNVANLLLARATIREREMAVRLSLGAGRGRLVRQLLTESILLSLMGGISGLALAWAGIHLIRTWNPGDLPLVQFVRLDGAVLAFMIVVSVAAGVLFGMAPARQCTRTNLNTAIQESGRDGSGGRRAGRLRSALVVSEIAVSLMLLAGAGLLLRSFANLQRVTGGFSAPPRELLTMRISPGARKYGEARAGLIFYDEVLQRARTVPGVEAAALGDSLPPDQQGDADSFAIEGQTLPPGEMNPVISQASASPDFFRVLGIPLVRGRFFTDYDTQSSQPVAAVSDAFARRYFPGGDALGKRIHVSGSATGMEITGVVGNVKYLGLTVETDAAIYMPFAQDYNPGMYLAARSSGDAATIAKSVTAEIQAIDPDVTLANVTTMEQSMAQSVAQPRFDTLLLASFAGIALLLAAIGTYGLVAGTVAQRTQEIGVRMALGAAQADVVRNVIRQGAVLAVAGILLGLAGAFALTRFLSSLLFGIGATDGVTLAAASIGIFVVVLLATFVPAFRASRVSPVSALRYQ